MYHFQRTVQDWPRAVEKLPDGALVKAIDGGHILRDVKAINPNITTMLRHFGPGQPFGGTFEENKQRARDYFATFIDATFRDQYAPHVDLVQEFNEYLASSHTGAELDARLTWAEAAALVWKQEYRSQSDYEHIRLALVNAPVGNDIHRGFAEIALQYDCVLSYHSYDHYINGVRDPGSWRYHCGRWHFMEESWGGLRPDWIHGEAGPYAGVEDGWRHSSVLGGDATRYVETMRRWIREIAQTPAYREGRHLGFALFTTGGTSEWSHYETRQPEMDMLAAMIAQEWDPGSEPPPPPEPEHDGSVARVGYKRNYVAIPPSTDVENAVQIFRREWESDKRTVGSSYDDAGVGCNLSERRTRLYDIAEENRQNFLDFYDEHYPGTMVEFVDTADLFVADRWDAPVGSEEERAGDLWPGQWVDANPFLNHYALGYHTGSDLNLNAPVFDMDRNMPVYAAAAGRVIYADTPSEGWQRVAIIRHESPSGDVTYSRYAHLGLLLVEAGRWLKRGQMLGTIGRNMTDDGPGPFHLHFDVSHTGILAEQPGHWPGENRQAVIDNYRNPKEWIAARR